MSRWTDVTSPLYNCSMNTVQCTYNRDVSTAEVTQCHIDVVDYVYFIRAGSAGTVDVYFTTLS
jgi:hypothetical protein